MSQVWFVTGSSVGLGRSLVECLLAAGHEVVATARNPDLLDDLARKHPERLLCVPLDVTSIRDWNSGIAAAQERFGRIDVLVNNAGFASVGSVEDIPLDQVRRQFETNFMGALMGCKAVLPIMRSQACGRIILISSIGARIATPGAAIYYASKAAISSLADSLALEVAPFGITVTAVEPGAMRTRFAKAESLNVSPFQSHYEATVGATVTMMHSKEYNDALHDPAGHARMILDLAKLSDPPSRILAGDDAFTYGTAAGAQRRETDLRYTEFSCSATGS